MTEAPYYMVCRALREHAKLSQREVAKRYGCSQQLISAFETGNANSATLLWWYLQNLGGDFNG